MLAVSHTEGSGGGERDFGIYFGGGGTVTQRPVMSAPPPPTMMMLLPEDDWSQQAPEKTNQALLRGYVRHILSHAARGATQTCLFHVGSTVVSWREREKGEGLGGALGEGGGLMLRIHVPPGTCIEPVNMSQSRIKESWRPQIYIRIGL